MRHEHVVPFVAIALLSAIAGCQGSASDEDSGNGGSSGGKGGTGGNRTAGKGGTAGKDPGPMNACDLAKDASATTMRRLSANEYDNTIADLLGDTSRPATASLPQDESAGGFAANSTVTLSQGDVEKLSTVARGVAERAVMRLADVLKCSNGQGDEACALAFIDRFGRLAYRRALTGDERDQLVALYRDKAKSDGHAQGVRLVIEATLQMPQFLYRPVVGVSTSKSGVNRLTGEEMASRLAFFLWSSAPDDALLSAAEHGDLDSADGVKGQAERMMKDSRFDRTLESFAVQWLDLTDEATKDDVAFPGFTTDTWSSAKASVAKFFSHVVNETDAKLQTLLTEPVAYVDKRLAPLYGMTASSDSLQKVSTDTKTRAGILTQPAVLAHLSGTLESSPVKRGVFVRSRLLCQPPPPPPPDGVPPIAAPTPTATQRQRLEQHRKMPSCAACHAFFDPLGLAFEHYDAVGAYRDKENGIAIDASGELTMTDVDGKFNDSTELIGLLKKSELVSDCLSAQFFRFAVGRLESDGETCALNGLSKELSAQGYSLREAMAKLTTSDVFRFVPVP